MNKKDLLISVLTKIQPYWDRAASLLGVVKNFDLPDSMLDIVLTPINTAVGHLKDKKLQGILQQQLESIKTLRKKEEEDRAHDESDAVHLLEHIDD